MTPIYQYDNCVLLPFFTTYEMLENSMSKKQNCSKVKKILPSGSPGFGSAF